MVSGVSKVQVGSWVPASLLAPALMSVTAKAADRLTTAFAETDFTPLKKGADVVAGKVGSYWYAQGQIECLTFVLDYFAALIGAQPLDRQQPVLKEIVVALDTAALISDHLAPGHAVGQILDLGATAVGLTHKVSTFPQSVSQAGGPYLLFKKAAALLGASVRVANKSIKVLAPLNQTLAPVRPYLQTAAKGFFYLSVAMYLVDLFVATYNQMAEESNENAEPPVN